MKAEIITIGDEILIGHTVDTNSAWIAQQLNNAGISILQITSISDSKSHITNALKEATERCKIVIITGGLGSTQDDITKKTLADYFNTQLIFKEEVLANIKNLFSNRGISINELNKKQAEVPASCKILMNKLGTAPGMLFDHDGLLVFSLPGVPYEMESLIENEVIPILKSKFEANIVIHKLVLVVGTFEAYLAEKLKEFEDQMPDIVKLAYLPSAGIIKLRFSVSGSDNRYLNDLIDAEIEKLKEIIPEYIFGYDNDTLVSVLGELLRNNRETLATAESNTGGSIAKMITSIPGSSDYFIGSVIAYSNKVKENILKVDPNVINSVGAVSRDVVEAMAKGARNLFNSTYAIATSGIAGPGGGSELKPVGTTWIAIAYPGGIYSEKFNFGNHRGRNITKASITALNALRKKIQNK